MNLFALTSQEFLGIVGSRWGKGAHYGLAAYRRMVKGGCPGIEDAPEFSARPELAGEIADFFEHAPLPVAEAAQDGVTEKTVFALSGGQRVESVWMSLPRRSTLCVSTQAGCRMGCAFCRTGALGLSRDLAPEEIVGQVFTVRHRLGKPVDNVVFMGMGEPLDNFENVAQAVRVISDQHGLDIPHSRITISTAGLPEGILRLGELGWRRINLALSLNAANDSLRSKLMPVNRAHPLGELKQALLSYPLRKRGVFLIEYVLMKGVNDGPGHARELIEFVEGLPVRVNVIGCNPAPGTAFESPGELECRAFCGWLAEAGIFVRLRSSRGLGLSAGCGQLGGGASIRG